MKVITWKLQKGRILGVLFLVAALICLTVGVVLLPDLADKKEAAGAEHAAFDEAGRKAFFGGYGWKVEPQPLEIREEELPPEPDREFLRMQKEARLEPQKAAGQRVKVYVYRVLNHPTGRGDVTATVFVHRGKAVAGYLALENQSLRHSLAWKGEPMQEEEVTKTAALPENCPTD